MHPFPHRFGLSWLCLLMAGCVAAATQPAFCESSPSATPPTQAAAVDPSSPEATGTDLAPPRLQGTELPVPPQQGQPWTPPATALPHEVVDAIKAVFDEGLADPQGCDYREITVAVGNCPQVEMRMVATHGWVFPGEARFAVCWNGLVYPLVSTGVMADLRADIASVLQANQEMLRKYDAEHPAAADPGNGGQLPVIPQDKRFDLRADGNVPEATAVDHRSMEPFKVVMLLRLGEGELAAKLWTQWQDAMPLSRPINPFLWLLGAWAWADFERAVSAHMRGDDHLALACALPLGAIASAYKTEEARKHYEGSLGRYSQLDFLDQVPDLIADTRRRLAEAPYTPVLEMKDAATGTVRIAGLIRDLELVFARQWGMPGGGALDSDPTVRALIKEGEPAIEPLLQCLEHDQRLTRSVHMIFREWSTDRNIPAVYEAAYVALGDILHTRFFGTLPATDEITRSGPDGRRKAIEAVRAFREAYGKLSVPERWYKILCTPGDPHWSEAVDWLTRVFNVPATMASRFLDSVRAEETPPSHGEPFLQGEPLRSKTDPSVTELLVRRLTEAEKALDAKVSDSEDDENLAVADHVARALAKWDGPKQLAVLQDYSQRLRALFDRTNQLRPALIHALAATYKNRVNTGDHAALDEYAAWLAIVTPDNLKDEDAAILFRLAWMHPESPSVQQAVTKLFAEKGGWSPVLAPDRDAFHVFTSLLDTPLVGLPGFRAELLRGLQDKRPAGEVKISKDQVSLEAGGGGSHWGVDHDSPLVPPDGSTVHFRVGDFYAFHLKGLPGAPLSELYWPEANRDQAIEQMAAYLEAYGDNLQCGPDQADWGSDTITPSARDSWFLGWPANSDEVRLGFPALDHPATAEDVRAHRAIFSLEGERRHWKLPDRPQRVIWTTLQDERLHATGTDASGKETTDSWYDQWAGAWQAEEVLKDGRWERFLGVVSAHRIARVPAAEIEFHLTDEWYTTPDRWSRLDHGFGGVLTVPHTQEEWLPSGHAYDPMPRGESVRATLQVRNQLAADQTLPADLFQTTPNAKNLPPGVKLTLRYSARIAPASSPQKSPPEPDELKPWSEVPCQIENPAATGGGGSGAAPMIPLEARTVFVIDLRDFFDVLRPGSYRLVADIQRPGVLVGQTAEASFTIPAPP